VELVRRWYEQDDATSVTQPVDTTGSIASLSSRTAARPSRAWMSAKDSTRMS
jgi:hypothetical protein